MGAKKRTVRKDGVTFEENQNPVGRQANERVGRICRETQPLASLSIKKKEPKCWF